MSENDTPIDLHELASVLRKRVELERWLGVEYVRKGSMPAPSLEVPPQPPQQMGANVARAETPPPDAPQILRTESGPMIKNAKSAGGHSYPSAARLARRMMFNVMRMGFMLASVAM